MNQKGMTLTEVLLSIVIIGIVVVSVISFTGYSQLSSKKEDRKSEAFLIAQSTLNLLRDQTFINNQIYNVEDQQIDGRMYVVETQDLVNSNSIRENGPPQLNSSILAENPRHISAQAITYLNGSPKMITVIVYWNEGVKR